MQKSKNGVQQAQRKNPRTISRYLLESLETRRMLSTNVLTSHNDPGRTGMNSTEVVLTPSNVNTSTFGKLFSYPVQGQIYAQPLYVSNLAIPGKGTRNVVLVVTQNNDVYALDANSNSGAGAGVLWHVNLGPAAAMPNNYFGNRYGPYHDINPQVGITGTPVIDLATNTMYLDAFTNDSVGVYSHHIHALDITTGADLVTPMKVSASVNGAGVGGNGTTIPFAAIRQLQRPALSLQNGVLYVTYGGFADTDPYHGWILGFDAKTLQVTKVLNTTPGPSTDANPGEGGIWQTGSGLASDGSRFFFLVGNGDFNPAVGNYSDSFLQVTPDTSVATAPHLTGYGLDVTDYFTPFNEQSLADADADLGSAGVVVLPDQPGVHPHEVIGGGKQGIVYVVDRDSMGHHTTTVDNVIQKVSLGHGNFNSPAYFNSAIYYHAVGDFLKKFNLTNGFLSAAPSAQSNTSYGGQGATPSISSNGNANGIVWDLEFNGSHEVLHAYDATTLAQLFTSNQNIARDQMGAGVKFTVPTVADGEVFVGSAGALTVYGLLTPPTTIPADPSGLAATAVSASAINLTWVDNSNNESGFKIERSADSITFLPVGNASANATSYLDSGLTANTLYYYRIRATNIIGDSGPTLTASATTPTATGAIYVYHFDAGSGPIAVDSVSGNHGTLTGTPAPTWLTPGKVGAHALNFTGDGTNLQVAFQSAVTVNNDLSPVLGSTSTLDAWIKTTQIGNATHYMAPAITGVEQAGGSNDIFWGTLDNTGRIGIYVGDAGGVYSTNPINNGQWHNVAMTRDAVSGMIQLYVDGILNGSLVTETGNKTSTFKVIGALSDVAGDGVTRNGDNYFNGQLDEIRIYSQVLGANEITGLSVVPGAPTLVSTTIAPGPVAHLTWTTPSSFTQSIEVDRKIGAAGTYAPIATLGGNITVFDDTTVNRGVQYFYVVKATALAGTSLPSNELSVTVPAPTIIANSIFYNGSTYDGQNGSSNLTDRAAIASDKQALLPGQTATFQNYTSYSKGINGIMIDVANLDNLPRFEDFSFSVGNDNNLAGWVAATVPTYINVYPGRGTGGATQITLIWPDNAIQNQWLRVALLANPHTNLLADDVFYFGNLIGGTGQHNNQAIVNTTDIAIAKAAINTDATITSITDFDRNGKVTITDVAIAKQNNQNSIQLINPPAPPPPVGAAAILQTAQPSTVLASPKSSVMASAIPQLSRAGTTTTATPKPRLIQVPIQPGQSYSYYVSNSDSSDLGSWLRDNRVIGKATGTRRSVFR